MPYSVLNLAYYQSYFDVDTLPLLKRVALAMVPKGGFIEDVCEGQIDLYGECLQGREGRKEGRKVAKRGQVARKGTTVASGSTSRESGCRSRVVLLSSPVCSRCLLHRRQCHSARRRRLGDGLPSLPPTHHANSGTRHTDSCGAIRDDDKGQK